MPDVPERCPFCNSGDKREETWQDKPAYSFSCGTVFYANGEVAWRYFACYAREKEQEERAIREQLAAARAEAEALRKRIEELEAVLRLVYDEFVLDVARWCRHCRLRIDDHEPECPMAEVERVLGLSGGAADA